MSTPTGDRGNDRVLIVGTGVIGTIYGWALARAGADVRHFVRPGRRPGPEVEFDVLDERKGHPRSTRARYPVRIIDRIDPADRYDLIIVPTNGYQFADVVTALAPHCGDATFLIMSSNWDGVDELDRLLGRDRYLLGYPDGGGTIRDGRYWVNLGAEIHLGEVDGRRTEKLARIEALFRHADMTPDLPDKMLHWLWVHNASTVAFQAGFAKYRDIRPLLRDRRLLTTTILGTRELLDLCARRGVDVGRYPDVASMRWPVWLVIVFMRALFRFNKSMRRYTAHAASPASLREAAENYAAMMRTADSLGMDLPHLR